MSMLIEFYISVRNYINKGMQETQYIKYLTYLLGIDRAVNSDLLSIMVLGASYIFLCLLIGLFWDWRRYFENDVEWSNRRNPFVRKLLEKR